MAQGVRRLGNKVSRVRTPLVVKLKNVPSIWSGCCSSWILVWTHALKFLVTYFLLGIVHLLKLMNAIAYKKNITNRWEFLTSYGIYVFSRLKIHLNSSYIYVILSDENILCLALTIFGKVDPVHWDDCKMWSLYFPNYLIPFGNGENILRWGCCLAVRFHTIITL